MRVTLNLAHAPSFRQRYGLWLAVPGVIVTLALMMWMTASTFSTYRRLKSVKATTVELQSRQLKVQQMEVSLKADLSRPATQALLQETSYVNGLIQSRKFSLTELTNKVSDLLPKDVRLDALALANPGEKPTIRLTVEGMSEPAIESFLVNLENSNDFSDVIVTSQRYPGGSGDDEAVVTNCTANYLDAAIPRGSDKSVNASEKTPIYTSIR